MDEYIIHYTGEQLDEAIGKALDPDDQPEAGSNNLITSGAVHEALSYKQNNLTFDEVPTTNSTNPVKSGGIKIKLDELASEIPSPSSSNPSMDGTASPGSSSNFARGDHVHPSDTSKSGKAIPFSVVLSASAWNDNMQTVSNDYFAASGYIYYVTYDQSIPDNRRAFLDADIYADNITVNGSMTFHCSKPPINNITVKISRTEAQT